MLEVNEDTQIGIVRMTAMEIRDKILKEELKILDVLKVFYKRAFTIGLQLEAIADVNIDYSIKRAGELQAKLESTKPEDREKLGLLFGVPVSIKDNINLKGRRFL